MLPFGTANVHQFFEITNFHCIFFINYFQKYRFSELQLWPVVAIFANAWQSQEFMTMIEQEYNIQIEYIFNRFPSFQKVGASAYKPGIESVKTLVEQLDNPHEKFRSVHIAGTNGKGSTSHMIAAALASTGLKVGLFTSPHLVDFRERIKTSTPECTFDMVPREFVLNFIKDNRQRFEELNVSFFEITTAMAFCWFAQCKVDIAVIECGLGGRLDSTNIITPLLSIITNIGLDHCALLGNTTEKIAAEKAGIIKPGVPVVIGEASGVAQVFKDKAACEGSEISFAEDMPFAGSEQDIPSKATLGVSQERFEQLLDDMDLGGDCQRRNLRTVLGSLNLLNPLLFASKHNIFPNQGDSSLIFSSDISSGNNTAIGNLLNLQLKAIENAARNSGLHGRWEILSREPFIVCDTGHNPHGFALLGNQICTEYGKWRQSHNGARFLMIFGVMADKDLDSIVDYLPKNAEYIFVSPTTQRAMKAELLEEKMNGLGFSSFNAGMDWHKGNRCAASTAELGRKGRSDGTGTSGNCEVSTDNKRKGNIGHTLSLYKEIQRTEDFVFIGGSTFVVAEALEWFEAEKSMEP